MPDTLTFTSVHTIPGTHASAAFTSKTSEVFKEEHNISPIIINERMKYIPWGGDNQMSCNIIELTVRDKTSLDITWIKQGGDEEEHTLAELMASIKGQSQSFSKAVSELEKLLVDIKED